MISSDNGGSGSPIDNEKTEDFDEMAETAVLDEKTRRALNGGDDDKVIDVDDSDDLLDSTSVLDDSVIATDNVGELSVEINVEELIADIESIEDEEAARRREVRRRLEEAVENNSFDDTYAIDLEND